VVAGFEDDAGGALHGLRGEKGSDIAGETDFDAGFGEGLKNDVSESGATGGQAGDGVHILFIDDHSAADGTEHGFSDLEVIGRSVGTATDAGHASAYGGAGVGHGANDGDLLANALFNVGGRNGSGDGNDQGVACQGGLDLLEDVADNLWLHGQKNDVGMFDGAAIVGGSGDAEVDSNGGGLFLVADGGGDVLGEEESLLEISAKKDAAQFTGAEDGQLLVGEYRGHGGNILTEDEGEGQQAFRTAVM